MDLAVSQQCIPFLPRELLALVEEFCIDGGGPHLRVFGVLHGGRHVIDFPNAEFFESCLDGWKEGISDNTRHEGER